jgi:hypothetical protein
MTKLTPKATRFIGAAVDEMADRQVSAIWASVNHDPGTELPDHVADAVLAALLRFERRLRAQLDTVAQNEDETSDISNDLGFVCAIEGDLRRQVGARS